MPNESYYLIVTDVPFSLKRVRSDAYSDKEVLAELNRIAKIFEGGTFSTRDFNKHSKSCTYQAVFRIFGTWEKALAAVGVTYKRKFASRRINSDQDLFVEMERVWKKLGHRPSRQEWTQSRPKYSYRSYCDRFDGWLGACGSFIEYKSGNLTLEEPIVSKPRITEQTKSKKAAAKIIASRTIPLKIRFKVLERDGYRCVVCGKSPATDVGIKLHLDHVIPYSKGGPSTFENLRSLCQDCNWGKGAG